MARSAVHMEESNAESFLERVRSDITRKDIMNLNQEIGQPSCDMLHPESCAWLEGITSRMLRSGNIATKFFDVVRFTQGYDYMLRKDEAACTNYISFVLRQGIILNMVVRGLREMAATKKCYLLLKDEEESERSGKRSLTLVPVNFSYTCLLSRFCADKRVQKYIVAQFPDLVDVQISNYSALALPGEIGVHSANNNQELESKIQVATSIIMLKQSGKRLSKTYLRAMLQDVVAASAYPPLLDDSVMLLHQNVASLNLLNPTDVLTVVSRVLEGSDMINSVIKGVCVLSHNLDLDPSFSEQIRGEGSLLSCLLGLTLAAPTDEMVTVPAIDVLQRTHPKLKLERMGPECLAQVKAVALKDRLARRKKLRFETFLSTSSVPGRVLSGDIKSLRSSCQEDEVKTGQLSRVRADPLRKCSQTECENVEGSPKEFKLCSQCRLAGYCSADCQKLAWKQGHKVECQRLSGGAELDFNRQGASTAGSSGNCKIASPALGRV